MSENIGAVCSRISEVIEIPPNCLHLVYGGRIMKKNENLEYYRVEDGAYIYAVDTRKYLKVISKK